MKNSGKIRIWSRTCALVSLILMGSGIADAKATIIEDAGSGALPTVSNDEEQTNIPSINPESEINQAKITDEWDDWDFQPFFEGINETLFIYEYKYNGKLTISVMYVDSKDDEWRYCNEVFEETTIFKHIPGDVAGEDTIVGVGEFEGKIEFVAWYEFSQYFEEIEKRSINLKEIETYGELRQIIIDTPSLIDSYIDLSNVQSKGNNDSTQLVYAPNGYMKFYEEEDTLETYARAKRG